MHLQIIDAGEDLVGGMWQVGHTVGQEKEEAALRSEPNGPGELLIAEAEPVSEQHRACGFVT
jgi:hypothetical protein